MARKNASERFLLKLIARNRKDTIIAVLLGIDLIFAVGNLVSWCST